MRVFGSLIIALLISLGLNGLFLSWNNSLRAERDAARAEVATLEKARAADARAYSSYDKARNDAATIAQGRRDALSTVTPSDTDDDVLQRCRDGLCLKGRTQGGITAARPTNPLSTSVDAGSPASR